MRFFLGLIIGVALGAAVGLLTATKPGSEMRQALRERMQRGADDLEEEA